jgi:hypothetical protein
MKYTASKMLTVRSSRLSNSRMRGVDVHWSTRPEACAVKEVHGGYSKVTNHSVVGV